VPNRNSEQIMEDDTHYDISTCSFEEFVDFLFGHDVIPVPSESGDPVPWYWMAEVEFDPLLVAGHYIRLFTSPEFLVGRFSGEQLEQGFRAIQSCNLECSVDELIWDHRVPRDIRESCVRSMEELFGRLFAVCGLEESVDMWWDSLAYDWHCCFRNRCSGGEDRLMQDVMFETLGKILTQPFVKCQRSALHGLGHLHHPGTAQLIRDYLARNPEIGAELRDYALAAARFDVQ